MSDIHLLVTSKGLLHIMQGLHCASKLLDVVFHVSENKEGFSKRLSL